MFDGDKSDLRPLERRDDRGPVSQISAEGAVEAMTTPVGCPVVAVTPLDIKRYIAILFRNRLRARTWMRPTSDNGE